MPRIQTEDFIGFTFKDLHSIRDLNIYRVSSGQRYNSNLTPTFSDKTMEIPGGDGTYFFRSFHKQKPIDVNIAFDALTETQLRKLKQLCSSKEVGELIFDESPYKVYEAKVTGTPQLKTICFDGPNGERIYKGEGTIQFTCFYPYAHTPDWVWLKTGIAGPGGNFESVEKYEVDGKFIENYSTDYYISKLEWEESSGLLTNAESGLLINRGDMPAPFKVQIDYPIKEKTTITIGNATATILEDCNDIIWDSSTGLITTEDSLEPTGRRVINCSGDLYTNIPLNETGIDFSISDKNIPFTASNIKYHFWYY